jgi:hypothetical protein
MSAIEFRLFEEDLRSWDDLVGDIQICGLDGGFTVEAAYVDSWLCSLAQCICLLESRKEGLQEVLEEPNPIKGRRLADGRVEIAWVNASAVFESLDDLKSRTMEALLRLRVRARDLQLEEKGGFFRDVVAMTEAWLAKRS